MTPVATVKVAEVIAPFSMVHVGAGATASMLVGVLASEKHVSAVSNPLPVTVTGVLTGPELGLRVMAGPTTVKLAEAESPVAP